MTFYYQQTHSPVGKLHIVAGDHTLHAIAFDDNWERIKSSFPAWHAQGNPLTLQTKIQLEEYFAGQRRTFDLPLHFAGTAFQRRTWQALLDIPFGQTRNYSEQASAIGRAEAVRAVGRTNGLNPISIVAPCHRVIAKSGKLAGYAGGLNNKRYLLELEGVAL